MSDLASLRASCRAVLARHQRNSYLDLSCVVCQQRVRGQDGSMEHYITAHRVFPVHFDDVADLDAFLACLRGLLLPHGDAAPRQMHCPVCCQNCGDDDDAWAAHIENSGHNRWTPDAIPSLAPFCISHGKAGDTHGTVNSNNETNKEETDDDVNNNNNNTSAEEMEDDEEDWDVEPAVCLFCDAESADCLRHIADAHAVDFCAAVRAHTDVKDLYDVIRIVNAIRRCVAKGECPWHYNNNNNKNNNNDDDVEMCRRDVAASSLEGHLRKNPSHALPRVVPRGDAELIPVMPGDAFISLVAAAGNVLDDDDEKEPDYPMVPTISEMARRRGDEVKKENST